MNWLPGVIIAALALGWLAVFGLFILACAGYLLSSRRRSLTPIDTLYGYRYEKNVADLLAKRPGGFIRSAASALPAAKQPRKRKRRKSLK